MAVVDTAAEGSHGESELESWLKEIKLGKHYESVVNQFKNEDIEMDDLMDLKPNQIEFRLLYDICIYVFIVLFALMFQFVLQRILQGE